VEYLIGLILALAVAGTATAIGLDRERVVYPTVLMVIASYYVLFAVMGASPQTLWFAVAAIVGHGVLTPSIAGLSQTRSTVLVARGLFDV
jgi:hypothetical protein